MAKLIPVDVPQNPGISFNVPPEVQAERDRAAAILRQGEAQAQPGQDPASAGAQAYRAAYSPQVQPIKRGMASLVPVQEPVQQQTAPSIKDWLKSPMAQAMLGGPLGYIASGGQKAMENFSPETGRKVGEQVLQKTGSPGLAAAADTGIQAVPFGMGPWKATAEMGGKYVAEQLSKSVQQKLANSVRDQTIKEGVDAGLVFPPSMIGGGTKAKILETIGRPSSTQRAASIKNVFAGDAIAKAEAGLSKETPLTEASLARAREIIAAPYREVESISPVAANAWEKIRGFRTETKNLWEFYEKQKDPKILKNISKVEKNISTYETLIEKEAERFGRADLVPALKKARMQLAKNYDVTNALTVGGGHVDTKVFAKMLDKEGEKRLSGGLKVLGKVADEFPQVMDVKALSKTSPGVSALNPYAIAALMGGGAGTTQLLNDNSYGLALGILPVLAGGARGLALSKGMQHAPQYGQGLASMMGGLGLRYGTRFGAAPLVARTGE